MKLLNTIAVSLIATFGFLGSLGVHAQAEAERALPTSKHEVVLSYAPLVKEAAPAVVNIYTQKVVRSRRSAMFDDPLFKRFFGDSFSFGRSKERVQGSLGSGVIVRGNGVIVTNNHVIDGADAIRVVLADRREFDAEVILADPRTDIAILKIEVSDPLPTLDLAEGDDVQVGDIVLAIGNPFGVGQTVTSGIVSATARTQQGISDFGFFIQTDAAVNPGNSGGALIGMRGDLLGINTAIYSRTGTSSGIGFAVPASMVKSVLRAALNEGQLARPWLGVKGQTVSSDLAEGLGLDRAGGVLIDAVYPGGPAEQAGLVPGDVIMAVAGKEVIDEAGLNFRIATMENEQSISIVVLTGGILKEQQVSLSLPPEDPARTVTKLDGRHPFQGVSIANMSPRFNDELQLDPFMKGVVVLEVEARTPSARWQFLLPGDVVSSMNGTPVDRVEDMVTAIEENASEYVYEFTRRGRMRQCRIVPNGSFRCADIG